jgi:hypothetical protein
MISIYRKLGELLVAHGEISNLQLSIALAAQQTSNRRLGEILVERGFTTEEQIASCLAHQYGYPLLDVTSVEPHPAALESLDLETALNLRVLPLEITPDEFVCAIADPLDIPATDQLANFVKRRLRLNVAPEGALLAAVREHYGLREETASGRFVEADHAPQRFEALLPIQRVGDVALFEAFDAVLERRVGLLAVDEKSDQAAAHLRLVRSAAKTSTRQICAIHDAFSHAGHRWTVTERLTGETLERVLRTRGKRSPQQTAELVSEVAEGVDRLHQAGTGCGWVCPTNILVRVDGPMLVPFATPPGEYVHLDAMVGGSSAISGDLHGLGVLLWECATGGQYGRVPFMHDADLPSAMRQILATCTDSDPARRYGSAIQLSSALRAYNWQALMGTASRDEAGADRQELLAQLDAEPGEKPTFWERLFGKRAA